MRKRLILPLLLAVLIPLAAFGILGRLRARDPAFRQYMDQVVLRVEPETRYAQRSSETRDFSRWYRTALFVDGDRTSDLDYDGEKSMERVYWGGSRTRLVDYHHGFRMDFPGQMSFDTSRSEYQITGVSREARVTLTMERSVYLDTNEEMTQGLAAFAPDFPYEDGVDQYIGYYQCRFLLNRDWQENNRVTVTPAEVFDAMGHKGYVIHAVVEGVESGDYDAFSYLFIRYAERKFFRILVRYDSGNTALRDSLTGIFGDFEFLDATGPDRLETDFAPVLSEEWSDETRQLYEDIASGDDLRWGIYVGDIAGEGIHETIPALEEKLDYRFPVVLAYVHSVSDFPSEFMEETWEQGRVVELTYQLTENNNMDIRGHSPLLDLYRGLPDERLREFARGAKAFGHPFLFRLNNEMNSDWTSYGGVNNMADPEVFVTVWRRIHDIFREEGVDNCIWIFNPNDRDCPPSDWNRGLNYYPGDEYVQLLGVTGYNNGTYYTQWAEEWREFDQIYDLIQEENEDTFGAFPWIITEFASSSIGGDKAAWIDNMFDTIGNYPNIKIAVWFSAADYDGDIPARPYWLDETEETVEAFRRGLHRQDK